jgi:hypothetical protein
MQVNTRPSPPMTCVNVPPSRHTHSSDIPAMATPMKSLIELKEIQSVLHALRAMARGRQAGDAAHAAAKNPPAAAVPDPILHRLDTGLHPLCEVCGERIGLEILRESPEATRCRQCAT